MTLFTFQETLSWFGKKIGIKVPEEAIEKGEVDLILDQVHLTLSKGKEEGSLNMRIVLGLLLQPISENHLQELMTEQFLGVNTGGCSLSLDEQGTSLSLNKSLSIGTEPAEAWEWLHRMLGISFSWYDKLKNWDEFVPLLSPSEQEGPSATEGIRA